MAQLQALSVGNPSAVIDTGEGELRITGITNKVGPAGPTSAELTYSYTLKAAQTHTGATATESTDVVALEVKDVNDVTGVRQSGRSRSSTTCPRPATTPTASPRARLQ